MKRKAKPISIWNPKPSKLFTYKVPSKKRKIAKTNMTWPQAKVRYPKMNPFRDTDRDGVPNFMDCRPFNKKKDGIVSSIKGAITKVVPKVVPAPILKVGSTMAQAEINAVKKVATAVKEGYSKADTKLFGGALPGGATQLKTSHAIETGILTEPYIRADIALGGRLPGGFTPEQISKKEEKITIPTPKGGVLPTALIKELPKAIRDANERIEAIKEKWRSKGGVLPTAPMLLKVVKPTITAPISRISGILTKGKKMPSAPDVTKKYIFNQTKIPSAPSPKIQRSIQPSSSKPTKPIFTYAGIPYSSGKTMAVEKGTGRIAREYGLNTQNADLEDHYFIEVNGQWRDMGIYNPALRERIPQ